MYAKTYLVQEIPRSQTFVNMGVRDGQAACPSIVVTINYYKQTDVWCYHSMSTLTMFKTVLP